MNLSNLASYIENTIRIACELGSYWNGGGFEVCQKIQKLLFPEGVIWDKENRSLLTKQGNEFFDLLFSVSDTYKNNNAKKEGKSDDLSSLVARAGLEPATFGL